MKQFIPQDLLIKYIFTELRKKVNAFIGAPIRDLPDKHLGQLTKIRKHRKVFFEEFYVKLWTFHCKTPKIVKQIESEISPAFFFYIPLESLLK